MKITKDPKYLIKLNMGTIFLTRGRMGAVLIEKRLHSLILDNNYEDLGISLLYGWKGYLAYSDDELIDEIEETFTDPAEIKQLLRVQDKRLKEDSEKIKREGSKLLKEIFEDRKSFNPN